jgi:cyclopropane fatty-acyl-phospholipid synthase-like methyltransferase
MNCPEENNLSDEEYSYEDGEYLYQGLPVYAGRGIHEYVFNHIHTKYSKESRILVLGAGSGAFDCRLVNGGYREITSIDINFDNYLHVNDAINFIPADLNEDFSLVVDGEYDLIIAIEVIEHLYSTDAFLNSCKKLLASEGGIVISTPNPKSYGSRWKFFLYGYHNGFAGIPALYHHINPIHTGIFMHHCHFNHLQVTEICSFDHEYSGSRWYKTWLKKIMVLPLKAFDYLLATKLKSESGSILYIELVNKRE